MAAGPLCKISSAFTIGMFACCAAVGAVCSIIIEEDLRRINYSKNKVQVQIERDVDVNLFLKDF